MAKTKRIGRDTLAVDYRAVTIEPSPESQRALRALRDEVVAEVYARLGADEVELEVARLFEGTP